jgi:hypothetical protein
MTNEQLIAIDELEIKLIMENEALLTDGEASKKIIDEFNELNWTSSKKDAKYIINVNLDILRDIKKLKNSNIQLKLNF